MKVQVNLPDDLVERIDDVAADRSAFITEAVTRMLQQSRIAGAHTEMARINELAEELNREAEDVLDYQFTP